MRNAYITCTGVYIVLFIQKKERNVKRTQEK